MSKFPFGNIALKMLYIINRMYMLYISFELCLAVDMSIQFGEVY